MDKRSMVPSDFGMVKDLVVKYGNKETIGRLAAMGQIDPTSAVLAGMMIDRIRGNAAMEQQPQTTVAQDVMAGQQAAGLGAIAPQGMQAAAPPMQPAAPPMQAPAGMASGGIAALDVPDDMFNEYASGGLVAFEDGGEVPSFQLGGVPGAFNAPDAAQPMGLTPFMNTRARLRAKYGPQVDQMSDTELQMLEARAIMGREPAAAPAAKPPIGPSFATSMAQAQPFIDQYMPMSELEKSPPTAAGLRADREKAYQAYGIDPEAYKKQKAEMEQMRSENKASREEAANMRLIEAGLGVLGGTSPFAAVNIGKGATPALQGFAQDVKEIKKLDRELARDMQSLDRAEDALRRGEMTADQARLDQLTARIEARKDARAKMTLDLGKSLNSDEVQQTIAQLNRENQLKVAQLQSDTTLASARINANKPTNMEEYGRIFALAQAGDPNAKTMLAAYDKFFSQQGLAGDRLGLGLLGAQLTGEEQVRKILDSSEYQDAKSLAARDETKVAPKAKDAILAARAKVKGFEDQIATIRAATQPKSAAPQMSDKAPAPQQPAAGPTREAAQATAGTKPRVTYKGKTYEFQSQDQADAFKKSVGL